MSSELNIPIDRSSPVPLYHQVVQGIEAAILSGDLAFGSRLANEIDLAERLKLSRPTMRKAMDELVRNGLLVRKRGVGTQVVSSRLRRPLELSSSFDELERNGQKPATKVLEFRHGPADPDVARALELPEGVHTYHLIRLRSVGGKPLALLENWVRDDIAEITEEGLRRRGLYQILREAGVSLRMATQRIGATVASGRQAQALGTAPGSALVTMERTSVDDSGRHIETGLHYYRADLYSFEMTLVQR